jgi:hypothetical protein
MMKNECRTPRVRCNEVAVRCTFAPCRFVVCGADRHSNPFVCRARWEFRLTPCNVSAAAAAAKQVTVWLQRAWCVDVLCLVSD